MHLAKYFKKMIVAHSKTHVRNFYRIGSGSEENLTLLASMEMSLRTSNLRLPPGLDKLSSSADDIDRDFVGDENLESYVYKIGH